MSHPLKGHSAIVGLGMTDMGRVYDTPVGFAVDSIARALDDAGLKREDLDGILVNPGVSWGDATMGSYWVQQAMGLRNLRYSMSSNIGGATAAAMIQEAALVIEAGLATTIACVFSDAPLKPPNPEGKKSSSASAYSFGRNLNAAYGQFGLNSVYAMVAQRHMHKYGTTNDHLGQVAVSERAWAQMNPAAQMYGKPLTLDDYHASRWIAEPFHLLDCCLVSNGGAAVIVTSAERARNTRQPPVYIWGFGQGHPGGDPVETLVSGAPLARQTAFAMAGVENADIQVLELYDCYTFTVLITLEDYGFCPKGESGPFVADGRIGPGGSLPVNTGGGQLSSFYMWGMTPITEAVIQARGQGGERQVTPHDIILASGNGGILSTHATLILSPLPS